LRTLLKHIACQKRDAVQTEAEIQYRSSQDSTRESSKGTHTRKAGVGLILASVMLMAGGVAMGGQRWGGGDVYVDPVARWAFGTFGGARNTSDTQQYVRCSAVTFADGWAIASCEFTDSNGVYGSCYTLDPEVMQIVQGMASNSRIDATWNDTTGECVYIAYEKGSIWEPKTL
jgi:hypothetical protein